MPIEPLNFEIEARIDAWMNGPYDAASKAEIAAMTPEQLRDAFYRTLTFGTGGLRGIMGPGSNRMNIYTVRAATQGLANYIRKHGEKEKPKIIIGYDSRRNSRLFAEESARVLIANSIEAWLFKELRPTPLISFACLEYECQGAIMITASHNPPEYNGYKVYWSHGGQVLPPHDTGIIAEVEAIKGIEEVRVASDLTSPLIRWIDDDADRRYLDAIAALQNTPKQNSSDGSQLGVVYSSLHGTGITLVPRALEAWGFTNVTLVAEQKEPDGTFPTVTEPNPEKPQALAAGIRLLKETGGDLFIATDPDADRVGAAVAHNGRVEQLTGHQVACLCLDHLCRAYVARGGLPPRAAFIKTVVTSDLFELIAHHYGCPCFNVLTGFKYIAELIDHWQHGMNGAHEFLFGGEESYGYLLGTHTRDKDAVVSAALICECALEAKRVGKTLLDQLHDLYRRFGIFVEELHTLAFPPGKAGRDVMVTLMEELGTAPPTSIDGVKVTRIENYKSGVDFNCMSGKKSSLPFPQTNMLAFHLANGTILRIRPSGTEPKIKVYCNTRGECERPVGEVAAEATAMMDAFLTFLEQLGAVF